MTRLLISAAHKSSGKTTLSIGLCRALADRGLTVQPFKKGPDYIDPMWLGDAAGRPCYNLDFQTQTPEEIRNLVACRAMDAGLSLIEGNKGLYDGMALDGSNSNAALAKLLAAPVVLVIDTRGITRGVAPLLLGYQHFDPAVRIRGVILNQVGGARHEAKLRESVEHYTDIPVLGAVRRNGALVIDERHLGLIPENEESAAGRLIATIAEAIAGQVDLDRLLAVARDTGPLGDCRPEPVPQAGERVRIAIARDRAFGFYYPDDLEALEAAGAELLPFDALADARLPDCDGLFIGGGFPETQMEALSANSALRGRIREAIEAGLPAYAECGGLMYLARSLRWKDRSAEMVGVIPGDVVMCERPQGRGYIHLAETGDFPWPSADSRIPADIPAHEFHYSRLENLPADCRFAYRVLRGTGIDGRHDGFRYRNLLACYAHLRNTGAYPWARRFVAFVRGHRQG